MEQYEQRRTGFIYFKSGECLMLALTNKKSIIGEGPIWNDYEQKLYCTNGIENEILIYDIYKNSVEIRKTPMCCAAVCFSDDDELIVSYDSGVGVLERNNIVKAIYDTSKYKIKNANDMKVGPDGRIYVGTQSSKRLGISNEIDGKLYSIDKYGKVVKLLDGLSLSNGLDWSLNGEFFYHTDSDSEIIKEYYFNKVSGKILHTGREVFVSGVDGFCIAENGDIYAACWGKGCVTVIDTEKLKVKNRITLPTMITASCSFVGKKMEYLAITTAKFDADMNDENAGLTFLCDVGVNGKLPYKFENV